jgi:glycosyltransferase involved in cell wall biosynthesis
MALEKLGYELDFLTLPIGKDEPAIHSRVIRAWNLFGSDSIAIGPSLLKLWFDLILMIQAIGLVLRNRYDVLHGTEETGFLCYLLSFICRARCVYEKHSDSASYTGTGIKRLILGIYNGVEKLTIKRADMVICTGPGLEQQARESSPNGNIVCIPDIPSSLVEPTVEQIKDTRRLLENDEGQILATYVGSFAEYQGVDIIFEAIPAVIAKNPKIKFVIIGGNDAEITKYRKILDAKGAKNNVVFVGMINPDILPSYLAASDILLAPRKTGINSPLKILDYFKAGAAIVATDTVANQRLLNSKNSVLCEFSASAFAGAICKLGSDHAMRAALSSNANRLYKSTYNFEQFRNQLERAYQSIA